MRAAAVLLSALALVAGCGSSDDDGRLTKEELIAQGDAICKRHTATIKAMPAPRAPSEVPRFVRKALPELERELAELRALRPPAEDEATIRRMLGHVDRKVAASRRLSAAVGRADQQGFFGAIRDGQRADAAADEIASAYGFESCGSTA